MKRVYCAKCRVLAGVIEGEKAIRMICRECYDKFLQKDIKRNPIVDTLRGILKENA